MKNEYIGSQEHFEDSVNADYDHKEEMDKQQEKDMMTEMYAQMERDIQQEINSNNRIFRAVTSIKGKGFMDDLYELMEDSECKGKIEIVDEPRGEFQEETGFGCIVGIWVNEYSTGDSGVSFAGQIWVKIKNYKYLEIPFSC